MSEGSDVWDFGILEGAGGFATSGALAILLVGSEVEGDEQDEVRADNSNTRESSEFLSGAVTRIRHPWEVGRGEVGVRCEVDNNDMVTSRQAPRGVCW